MKSIVAFVVGLIFALGLGMSGMTQPQIVRGFLDIFGNWDPRLAAVMASAVVVHSIAYYLIRKRRKPILDQTFHVPTRSNLDRRLLGGAALFGLGWGWAGICPGPALVGLGSGNKAFLIFIVFMVLGMKVFQIIDRKQKPTG
jgi:uncharacterized membrane protein YedE/YeeE